jgi:hypothetical protein
MKVHCSKTTFDMKENQTKSRAFIRGKITHFGLIIIFFFGGDRIWIIFRAIIHLTRRWCSQWMNIFVRTVTYWLNIWELHGLWIFASKWLYVHKCDGLDSIQKRQCVFVPQKNMKLALCAMSWGRSWTALFLYVLGRSAILRECSKCSWWKVGQMTHCINCIMYSLVNERRDFAVELIN